ncbi:MAG: outer membrane beta-barrel protein, partial [Rhodoferax sp.]|nr:outer membrane beta-barrel protein [Rhodoferax sp.]
MVVFDSRIIVLMQPLLPKATTGMLGVAAWLALAPATAVAQEAGTNAPRWSVVPRVSVTERFTDNVSLSSTGKKSELVTTVRPGISIRSNAGRLKGNFDYSLNQIMYARGSSARQSQNALNSALS